MAGVAAPTVASNIGTNNVTAVDNSQTVSLQSSALVVQETLNVSNHSSNMVFETTSSKVVTITRTGGPLAKGRLSSIRLVLDQILVELQYMSKHGCDKEQYHSLDLSFSYVSSQYFELEAKTTNFIDSLRYSKQSKALKADVKRLHHSALRASDATRQNLARQNVNQQPPFQQEAPPLPKSASPQHYTPLSSLPTQGPMIVVERLEIHFH